MRANETSDLPCPACPVMVDMDLVRFFVIPQGAKGDQSWYCGIAVLHGGIATAAALSEVHIVLAAELVRTCCASFGIVWCMGCVHSVLHGVPLHRCDNRNCEDACCVRFFKFFLSGTLAVLAATYSTRANKKVALSSSGLLMSTAGTQSHSKGSWMVQLCSTQKRYKHWCHWWKEHCTKR